MELQILYINLDRSVERNNKMIEKLNNLNVLYERISGIDGENLNKNALMEGKYNDMNYLIKKNIKLKPRPKEIAIILSHIKALNKIIENNYEMAVIIEDDLSFQYIKDWNIMINNIIIYAPSDWKIIKLHTSSPLDLNKNINLFDNKINYIPLEKTAIQSAGCYIIKKEAALELINKYKINDIYVFPNKDEFVVCECVVFSIDKIYMYTGPYICVEDNNITCAGGKNVADFQTNKIIHSYWKNKTENKTENINVIKINNIIKPLVEIKSERKKIVTMKEILQRRKNSV